MMVAIPTRRSRWTAWVGAARAWCARPIPERLQDVDRATLRDIGVHPSELLSIEAEARGLARPTRRRIAWHGGAR